MRRNTIFSNHSLLPIVLLGIINRFIDPDFVFYHLNCWRSFSYTVTFSGWNIYTMDVYLYPPLWAYMLSVVFTPFSGLEDVLLPFGLMFMSLVHLLLIFLSDVLVTFLIYKRTESKKDILLPLALLFVSFMPYVGIHYGMFESIGVFLSLCGILLILKEHFFLGGFMFAISALTKQWTLLATGLIFLYLLRWKRTEGLKYLLGTLVLPLVCLPFYLNDPQNFLDKAVFYKSTIAHDGYGLWGTLWFIYTSTDIPIYNRVYELVRGYQPHLFVLVGLVLLLTIVTMKKEVTEEGLVHICFLSTLIPVIFSSQVLRYYLLVPMIYGVYLYGLRRDRWLLAYLAYVGLFPNLGYLPLNDLPFSVFKGVILTVERAVHTSLALVCFGKGICHEINEYFRMAGDTKILEVGIISKEKPRTGF
ncbi:MAG: DUF2029 domain-containing protein [Candidatus Bathyarchaeota archaeon]|nr:MAG: DUF2029 domain-containing protein [Candidatus Bathyarchaeota archaeon]